MTKEVVGAVRMYSWLVGVVIRRYIDFLTSLVLALFCSSISTSLFIVSGMLKLGTAVLQSLYLELHRHG